MKPSWHVDLFAQISLSSELQPGSLPADESSSDMLVIVDEPLPTNSPASGTGSVSDNMNGEEKEKDLRFIFFLKKSTNIIMDPENN